MAERAQTYKTHIRWMPAYHFFVLPVLLLNFVNAVRHAWLAFNGASAFASIVAFALLALGVLARVQVNTVQDRVIRLEMRLRLRGLLPPDLQPRINDLTHRQLVALRFASDAEMADLVRDVLDGRLTTSKEIKLRVKSWQPDWLRA